MPAIKPYRPTTSNVAALDKKMAKPNFPNEIRKRQKNWKAVPKNESLTTEPARPGGPLDPCVQRWLTTAEVRAAHGRLDTHLVCSHLGHAPALGIGEIDGRLPGLASAKQPATCLARQ